MFKKTLILVCLIAALSCSLESEKSLNYFLKFMKQHNKEYKSTEEFIQRFEIFVENLEKNSEYIHFENEEPMFSQFFDLTPKEFASTYLTLDPTSLAEQRSKMTRYVRKTTEKVAPDAYDWRDQGAVTPVKNQGTCGSCWAFSTTGNLEGQNKIVNKKLISLSEQQIVDCDTAGEDKGCQGGLMDNAFQYIQSEGGLQLEDDYKYTGKDGKCKVDKTKIALEVIGYNDVSQNEDEIAEVLFENGPLSVALNAQPLQFYFGGIFHPIFCNPKNLDHGVLLVGYGQENGKKYWIVKNSWGAVWGEKGYFRILRGSGTCGINTAVSTGKVKMN
jgi:cathepsin F